MKKLSIALSLVLCAVLFFALGTVAFATEAEPANVLEGDYTLYSTNYNYGEEVDGVKLALDVELDPETVSAEDFQVYTLSGSRKSVRTITGIEVDGNTVMITVKVNGSAVNINATTTYNFDLVGSVTDSEGVVYTADSFECVGQVNPAIDRFIEGETENMKYRLFVPEDKDGESAPLLVWLHGGGEFGTENRAQLSAAEATNYANPEIQELFGGELFVLCPQSPAPKPHITSNIMETIYDVCEKYDIDMSRIYIAGCSQGGKTTIELISEYPTFFAAAVSNCPYQTQVSPEAAKNLTDLPIIFVHATNDTTAMPYESIISYDNLRAAGNENAWCLFYSNTPNNDITGRALMGHFSWAYVHDNLTTTEEAFIKGEGVYSRNGVDYPYVSTPLSEIGEGYDSLWQWVADQQREEVVLNGNYNIYSTCYNYGEEVHTVVLDTGFELDPETVSAEDFEVYFEAVSCGSLRKTTRAIESIEVDGSTITMKLVMKGSATNTPINDSFTVNLIGEVAGLNGYVFTSSDFNCLAQINEDLDKFLEGETEDVKYRLYLPETDKAVPLYVWLHGSGEFGTDNRIHVSCSNLPDWTKPEVQGEFENGLAILAIQGQETPHKPNQVMDAILKVCNEYNIDMGRIYLVGCSRGGLGVNETLAAYPEFFAAAISDCASEPIPYDVAETLVDLPIIFVHALNDTTNTPNTSIEAYQNLKAAGSENVWCTLFTKTPNNPFTGGSNMGHFSWIWIHNNFTSLEEEFVVGEGVYTKNGVEYPYVSTPLYEIGEGYDNIAAWLADKSREPVLIGDFDYYSTCYDYGEEVHTVVLETGVELDAETISVEDFEVYFEALSCGSLRKTTRTVESIEVDGTTVTLKLVMKGSGTNAPIGENFYVNLVGEVADLNGNVFTSSALACGEQINEQLDKMLEFVTEDVQYRLYAPEAEGEAPLYIWLHGAGEFGTDNRSQVSCSSLVNWLEPEVQDIFGGDLYVMAIQSPTSPHVAAKVMDAIMDVCTNYDIDMSRIYLAGCSMGGQGVHTMITAYPDFFAAAIPNCPASTISAAQAELLVDLPILYVHAADDTTVRLTNSINSYNNIVAAGSDNVWCAFFENSGRNPVTGALNQGHWSWTWIHKNFTSNEAEFIKGEGEYNGLAYYSTPLSEIGEGYANVASWLADQKNENVIYVGNFTAVQGDVVEIPVYIDNAADISTFRVQLNNDIIEINEVVMGDILDVEGVDFTYNKANGMISWAAAEDISGDGVLFTIVATIVDPTANGEYVYSVEVIDIFDGEYNEADFTAVDGFITIDNPIYAGDVTMDGSITNGDVIILARYLVELENLSADQLFYADYSGDGVVNNLDLVMIIRSIVEA